VSRPASELARALADAWLAYAVETLASVDARSGSPSLSQVCPLVADTRTLLGECLAGRLDYHGKAWNAVRFAVLSIPEHLMDKHPEHWHLLFDDPGPAATAAMDQVEAARREAATYFGPK
jgi:hypothetical protein